MKLFNLLSSLFLVLFTMACNQQMKRENETSENDPDNGKVVQSSLMPLDGERKPLLLTKDCGATWIDASQGLPANIQVTFLEKYGNELVMATDNMGVFKSENNKMSWKKIGENLPGLKINALHVYEKRIFVGVYDQGIFRSVDGGTNWEGINHDLSNLSVQAILQSDNRLFVGTDNGIFFKTGQNSSWQPTTVSAQILSLYEYENIIVAGTSLGTVISKDNGNNWTWIRQEGAVHYTHGIGKRIVELCLNGDLFYTDDWGENWQEFSYAPREGSYVYEIIKAGDCLLMSNNYGIHRSFDNGASWEHIFKTESMGFLDLLEVNGEVYGGTRDWDEYRKRN